jgi:hypothetical protein
VRQSREKLIFAAVSFAQSGIGCFGFLSRAIAGLCSFVAVDDDRGGLLKRGS